MITLSVCLLHPKWVARFHITYFLAPLHTTYAPYIISFLIFCWQLLRLNSNLQLFMQLKPYCQHPYPEYTTIPGCELSFSGVTRSRGGRWAEVTRSKTSWGLQPKHTWWHSCCCFFSPLFGVDFHLELKTDHSLLFICSSSQTKHSGEAGITVCLEFSWQLNRDDGTCLYLYSTCSLRLSKASQNRT